ncbi:MAG: PKD domain-containing protein, partial [Bacteroidota bacterium]
MIEFTRHLFRNLCSMACMSGILVGLMLILSSEESKASHAMGADLTYEHISGNTYRITFSFYRFCDGIFPPSSFTVTATSSCYPTTTINIPCINFNTPTEISPVCSTAQSTCTGGTFIGVQQYIYQGNITLPGPCVDWRFSAQECCRNATITTTANGAGDYLHVFALLNNTNSSTNNSPTFANYPVPFACRGQRFCFNHGASDVDGDSLVFQMITPLTVGGVPLQYGPGYTAAQPVTSVPAVRFDPRTGDICMDPTQLEVTVFAVLVSEYRNGVLIGQVERDIQLNILQCSNRLPSLTGINGLPSAPPYSRTVCAGDTVSFFIATIDPDPVNSTYMSWDYAIAGATFNIYGGSNAFGGHRDSARFTWVPSMADVGNVNCFSVFVSDDNCPILGTSNASYCIDVRMVDVNAGADVTVPCGQCTTLTANAVGGTAPYTYTWNPLRPDSVVNQSLNPACVGSYVVRIRDASCTNFDTVNVLPGANNILAAFNSVSNCSGAPVIFTDQTTGGAVSSWAWSFGDGGTSNIQNPTHQYAANGTYNVQLIVTAAGGCRDTINQQVTVNTNIPVAQFNAPGVCQGASTPFTNQSTGTQISTYSWNFGDPNSGSNNTSTSQNPSHTYTTSGTFTTTLIVVNLAGCSDTVQQIVTVNALPTVNVPGQQICLGQSATLSASSGFAAYSWNSGQTTQSITVTPPSTIGYSVIVTDANGCTATDAAQVIVEPLPVPSAGSNQTICQGASATLTASGANSYAWNPGALNGFQVSVTPSSTTTYTVTATSFFGCTGTATVTINVNPMPIVNADNNAAICKGESITINAASTTGNFQWQPGSQSGSSISVTPLVTTTYTVTVSDAIGCSGSDQVTITVNPIPDALFGTNAPQCEGFSVSFTDQSTVSSGSVTNWSWDFGNGQTAVTQNPTTPYSTNGNYDVILIVTSDGGCKDTISNAIIIHDTPVVSAGADQQVCPGFPATLNGSGGVNYSWSPGGATTASITVSPNSTTQYNVTVTDANGCQNSSSARVIVNPAPLADAGPNQSLCSGESTVLNASGGAVYTWFPGNIQSQSLNLNSPASTATYTVIVANAFGCLDTDQVQVRVNPLPVATFSNSGPVCNSISVSFTDQTSVGSGSVVSWQWDLGNGVNSTVQNPSLQYSTYGNFNVRLIVTTDEGCRDTVNQQVSIYAEPVASFSSVDVCEGLPVAFTNSSSIPDATALNHSWTFGDNATSTTQSPSHQYGSYGSYPVTLLVVSPNNCRDSITRFANVFPLPDAQFSSLYACEDQDLSLTDLSTVAQGSITNWSWQFGDGSTGSDRNPDHVYSDPGDYVVDLLVVTDNGCRDSINSPVRVVPAPLVDFATQDVCLGFETQ